MTLSLADRSQKTSGIKVLSQVGWDPDQNREQMIKVRGVYYISMLESNFAVSRKNTNISFIQ